MSVYKPIDSTGRQHAIANRVSHHWEWADETARNAEVIYGNEVGMTGIQLDDGSLWYLSDETPTWIRLSGGFDVLSGSLTNTYIPKATGEHSLADSLIQDDGTEITINSDLKFDEWRLIAPNTTDGSDSEGLSLCGGGDWFESRGAYIDLYGNEAGGDVDIYCGLSGGSVSINIGGNTVSESLEINNSDGLSLVYVPASSSASDFIELFSLLISGRSTGEIGIDLNGANLALNDGYISNDGDDEGISIDDTGKVAIGHNNPDVLLHVETEDATTSTIIDVARFSRFTSGTSGGGCGVGIALETESVYGNSQFFRVTAENVTDGSNDQGQWVSMGYGAGQRIEIYNASGLATSLLRLYSNNIRFGKNTGEDTVVTFDGDTHDGVITWREDEDYFMFSDDILMLDGEKIYFRNSETSINSTSFGTILIHATNHLVVDNSVVIGTGASGIDYALSFDGETHDGVIYWKEDEDYFLFDDDILLPDNEKAYFGTGSDADIYYDGTDFWTHTDLVAPSDWNIDCGTDKTIELQETVWEDVQFPISDGRTSAANYPDWDALTTNTKEYAFDVDDYIDLSSNELIHKWKEGTTGNFHLHLSIPTANSSGSSEYAKWTAYIAYVNSSDIWTETSLTAEQEIPDGSSALQNFYLDLGDVSFAGLLIGTQVKVRLKRIAATGGTEYSSSVFAHQVGCHIECNTLGSRTEAVK
jgi:hypothetical protein